MRNQGIRHSTAGPEQYRRTEGARAPGTPDVIILTTPGGRLNSHPQHVLAQAGPFLIDGEPAQPYKGWTCAAALAEMPMSTLSPDEIRAALARHLESELLLGARALPLRAPAPGARRAGAPAATPVVKRVASAEVARREKLLQELNDQQVKSCTACGLCETRTQTVFGQGNPAARLVFVGEAPGADEDRQGLAFVGKAGQLLGKMIEAMGLTRDDVFICNILKCRPPNNRDPAPDEISACWPFLDQQLRIIQPEVIVALGKPASQTLLRTSETISRLRGNWHQYYTSGSPEVGEPTPLMPTFHPAYLLRNPSEKAKAWSDLQAVMKKLGLPLPKK